jgi:hypothetical protein
MVRCHKDITAAVALCTTTQQFALAAAYTRMYSCDMLLEMLGSCVPINPSATPINQSYFMITFQFPPVS